MRTNDISALPIPVRPVTGEHYTSYLRRLAEANHLLPSTLRAFVNADGHSIGTLRLDRFAAAAGREPATLRLALTGLPEPHRPTPPGAPPTRFQKSYQRQQAATASPLIQDWRLAADEIRYLDEVELFATIRADRLAGTPVRELARRHFVGERLIDRVLRGSQPRPAALVMQDFAPAPAAPTLDLVKKLIDHMHSQGMTCDQIWARLVDHHQAAISKPTVKKYLRNSCRPQKRPAANDRPHHRDRPSDTLEGGP
ncbi:hypothetical protein GCM10009839_59180 [Catenulispora yoronensis]|uniref:Uncharacterized protein n=1 Tax=Catenulispora yoronensis TaxID=450799 RepID=A0ABN2UZP4_9ACTN